MERPERIEYLVNAEVVGEPFLSRCTTFREEYTRVVKIWREWAIACNAKSYHAGNHMIGLYQPHGQNLIGQWKLPNRKGICFPFKNSDTETEMRALPNLPSAYDVFGDEILTNYSYKTENNYGGGSLLGSYFTPRIEWSARGTFILQVPHIEKWFKNKEQQNPYDMAEYGSEHFNRAHYCEAMQNWKWPAGLREISEVEREYIIARDRFWVELGEKP